ncbi:hypothetical protein O6H91_13G037800 [Diphasiastrum complanatum]|uniref:Uncharacterized protein n=1 Tax=Diphasiastrum complanatum TaxID=34168 RepID=A0ACC2BU42_DIPCM|nr:hypothetical protein O6H91_13G037800 [Diphasiastrum complanatum]
MLCYFSSGGAAVFQLFLDLLAVMIKRQYYTLLHPTHNRDDVSASSSSDSSASDSSTLSGEAGFQDEDASWPASSHESDSSHEPDEGSEEEEIDSKGGEIQKSRFKEAELGRKHDTIISLSKKQKHMAVTNNDLKNIGKKKKGRGIVVGNRKVEDQWKEVVEETEKEKDADLLEESVVVHIGRVMKCKLCPKRVILSEDQMSAHLCSKGHARSLKLFEEGRLKKMLNSDGEEEEEAETHAERHVRTIALLEKSQNVKRKWSSGRQRQRKRAKRKALLGAESGKGIKKAFVEGPAKPKRVKVLK